MFTSSSTASRCVMPLVAAAALACSALCSQAAAHGSVNVVNSLPIDLRCTVVGVHHSAAGPFSEIELYEPWIDIAPSTRYTMDIPSPVWPARALAGLSPHLASDAFSHLRLTCQSARDATDGSWRNRYSVEFYAEPESGAVDDGASSASRVTQINARCSGCHVFAYPLSSVTPTALTLDNRRAGFGLQAGVSGAESVAPQRMNC